MRRRVEVTIKPIVYTGVWYSVPSSDYPGLNSSVTNWPSWIAAYNGQNVQSGGPSSSYPWSTWTVWQYDDTNWSGGDSDVFNGTQAQLVSKLVINEIGFTAQPVLHRAVDVGDDVSFTATAAGTGPLKYQWRNNGTNILNATNTTLNITNVQISDAGSYTLLVTNSSGSAISSPVSLTVYPPQATVFSDSFDSNTAANWIVNKSSSDTAVAFNFDYSALGIPAAPHSSGGTTRGVQMKANLSAGAVSALSISPLNQNFTGDYRLHFDGWININGPFPAGGAGSTEYLTAGIGTGR
ncbi:MAG: immunoglobulin domain-containing protein [Limisphaerales bacterium]